MIPVTHRESQIPLTHTYRTRGSVVFDGEKAVKADVLFRKSGKILSFCVPLRVMNSMMDVELIGDELGRFTFNVMNDVFHWRKTMVISQMPDPEGFQQFLSVVL